MTVFSIMLPLTIAAIIVLLIKNENFQWRERGERIADQIISATGPELFRCLRASKYEHREAIKDNLKTDMDCFIRKSENIRVLEIALSNNDILFYYNRNLKNATPGEVTIKKQYHIPFGLDQARLTMILFDNDRYKKMENIADVIISANTAPLWDYDYDVIENNITSFMKDDNISKITVKDENGFTICEKNNSSLGEDIHLSKPFIHEKKMIGTLTINFSNNSLVRLKRSFYLLIPLSMIIALILSFLLIYLIKNFPGKRPNQNNSAWKISADTELKINKAIEYINSNYSRNISRDGLALMVGLNRDNLGRYFLIYTGVKISEYINRLRIEDAKFKISNSDHKILDIALAVGYDNVGTFNRVFTELEKTSPSEYRRKNTVI